jgi:hypothetical protein
MHLSGVTETEQTHLSLNDTMPTREIERGISLTLLENRSSSMNALNK